MQKMITLELGVNQRASLTEISNASSRHSYVPEESAGPSWHGIKARISGDEAARDPVSRAKEGNLFACCSNIGLGSHARATLVSVTASLPVFKLWPCYPI
jgi:hypothetical protein